MNNHHLHHLHLLSLGLLVCLFVGTPLTGYAHGEVDLCDRGEDLIVQCGEFHDCVVDEMVSSEIGYCKAEFEDLFFAMCDRRVEGMGCEVGEICKIGIIDAHIGVCMNLSGTYPTANETMDQDDQGMSDESGCQSPSSLSSRTQSIWSVLLLLTLCLFYRTRILIHRHDQLGGGQAP